MADNGVNSTTISRTDSGFPAYLDFTSLRDDSIEYLGTLTGKVWTDYNLHDPGITILEILCYAILDLGYRTNFPAADIFANDPAVTDKNKDFFTPSRILTCNPLTIIDYRKMLIDLEGVKNAWLDVADDQPDLCRPNQGASSLNGLYHVSIELEDEHPSDDIKEKVLGTVKKALMQHRNFCEDFVDISLLCHLPLGVCADIELENDADVEEVYKGIISSLKAFFSPSPRFYTLQELLDKKLPIEDIFAGRPYDLASSHGFVDTGELETIELKKEIHLSDVYQVIFTTPGVRNVRRLRLMNCSNPSQTIGWKLNLPQNHIPVFSTDCSTLSFTQNGKTLQEDLSRFDGYLGIELSAAAKILYTGQSPVLDTEVPRGNYRKDLGDYYSIQHEFPRVYGIAQGGLPNAVKIERKAQALQLKGYLLFFDQLFANYLTQLKNIRGLFSIAPPDDEDARQTYFPQEPTTVPDLDSLIRFADGDANGAALATIVDRKVLQDALIAAEPDAVDKALSTPYVFGTPGTRDIAIQQLTEDLLHMDFSYDTGEDSSVNFIQLAAGCWTFYVYTSSDGVAVVGKGFFKSREAALQAWSSLKYLGAFSKNYNHYLTEEAGLSFNISSNLAGYGRFLQLIVENKALYRRRKGAFLDHLLSRFAEKFTDFALLSYPFMGKDQLADAVLRQKQQFLSRYDKLSSGRGQGYDYSVGDPVSGFESKVAAIAGFDSPSPAWLCNFVVEEMEDQFVVQLKIGEKVFFTDPKKYYSAQEAEVSAKAMLAAMQTEDNYKVVYDKDRRLHSLKISYGDGEVGWFRDMGTKEEMNKVLGGMSRLFVPDLPLQEAYVSKSARRIIIRDGEGNEVSQSNVYFTDEAEADEAYKHIGKDVPNASFWHTAHASFNQIYLDDVDPSKLRFVDITTFKTYVNDNVPGKPGKFDFGMSDQDEKFRFASVKSCETKEEAEQHSLRLILYLTDLQCLKVYAKKKQGKYFMNIVNGNKTLAKSVAIYGSEEEVKQAIAEVNALAKTHLYLLSLEERPVSWQFDMELGDDAGDSWHFSAVHGLETVEAAKDRQKELKEKIQELTPAIVDGKLQLVVPSESNKPLMEFAAPDGTDLEPVKEKVARALELKKGIISLHAPEASFSPSIIHTPSEQGLSIVYRLVDKDHLQAVYVGADLAGPGKDAALDKKKTLYQDTTQYEYLDICLGGDIFDARVDGRTGLLWYHYQIKSRKPLFGVEELVLFESVLGYTSEEDAQKAFDRNYLKILRLAGDPANYTEKAFTDVVFVPERTRALTDTDVLVKLAQQYPVRVTDKGDQYYFVLTDEEGNERWKSVELYPTPERARKAFYFFYQLLFYPGNYTVQDSLCGWAIYIREVLAESRERYPSTDAAWAAVEKFICVAQSKGAFHAYFDVNTCGNTFFVACRGHKWKHPCQYQSAQERNTVRATLLKSIEDFYRNGQLPFLSVTTPEILLDIDGKELGKLWKDAGDKTAICARYLELVDRLYHCPLFEQKEDGFYLMDESGKILLQSLSTPATLEEWKKKLMQWAYYFPVVRDLKGKYCVELRLPGFNHFGDDIAVDAPCGCGGPHQPGDDKCFVAWRGDCCFSSCQEALSWYFKEVGDLRNDAAYRSVFFCECGGFGIEWIPEADIVAFNPQWYLTDIADCEAITRAKGLINAEGLHAVEHILLRPRCTDDCGCDWYKSTCDNSMHCSFEWHAGDKDDPCNDPVKIIPFIPGADPYSFIATIALPAWPERFRSKEGRSIMEDLLHREAPAHVLLRILWLTPKDLCAFEGLFRHWKYWLTWDKQCEDSFSPCTFATFLFTTPFKCLDDCTECPPCQDKVISKPPCFTDPCDQPETTDQYTIVKQINDVFCWGNMQCGDQPQQPSAPTPVLSIKKEEEDDSIVDQRFTRYRDGARLVMETSGNELAGETLAFLQALPPSAANYKALIEKIIRNEAPAGKPVLSKARQSVLAATATFFYLDYQVFNGTGIDTASKIAIEALKKAGINPAYALWNEQEVKKAKPAADIRNVYKVLR